MKACIILNKVAEGPGRVFVYAIPNDCAGNGRYFSYSCMSFAPEFLISTPNLIFLGCFVQDIKVEGLVTMKAIMERRKVEIKEEEEAAEAKQTAEREVCEYVKEGVQSG